MSAIGIKVLKANLSEYVARARAGERIIITDRGEEVAEIGPLSPDRQALKGLVAAGKVRWNGRKPRIRAGSAHTGESVAAAVIEDRR